MVRPTASRTNQTVASLVEGALSSFLRRVAERKKDPTPVPTQSILGKGGLRRGLVLNNNSELLASYDLNWIFCGVQNSPEWCDNGTNTSEKSWEDEVLILMFKNRNWEGGRLEHAQTVATNAMVPIQTPYFKSTQLKPQTFDVIRPTVISLCGHFMFWAFARARSEADDSTPKIGSQLTCRERRVQVHTPGLWPSVFSTRTTHDRCQEHQPAC